MKVEVGLWRHGQRRSVDEGREWEAAPGEPALGRIEVRDHREVWTRSPHDAVLSDCRQSVPIHVPLSLSSSLSSFRVFFFFEV